ncbi:cysteine peptidase family C39 domain-containing protein [Janthinobacterium sp. CG_23.3]
MKLHLQTESSECGLACLVMIASQYPLCQDRCRVT